MAWFVVVAAIAVGFILLSTRNARPPVAGSNESSAPVAAAIPSGADSQLQPELPAVTPSQALEVKEGTTVGEGVAETGAPIGGLVEILKDASQPLKARIKAARALLADGSNEAMVAVKEFLWSGPGQLRAAIAEALGSSPNPESYSLMLALLSEKDEAVAMGAVRGLAQHGSNEAMNVLRHTLFNIAAPANVRAEAALALGTMNQPGVADLLANAAAVITDERIIVQVLNALGSRSFAETQNFFENYLKSPGASGDLKVTALEALAESKGDASAFLAGFAQERDETLRAAAAWALSSTDEPGAVGEQLLAWLQQESDPTVRLRLYQALGNQETFDVARIQELVLKEPDPSARTIGFDLIAKTLRNQTSPELIAYFDQNAVIELYNAALNGPQSSDRMAAVVALKRAGTPRALSALQGLAEQAGDPRVRASAAGRPSGKPSPESVTPH